MKERVGIILEAVCLKRQKEGTKDWSKTGAGTPYVSEYMSGKANGLANFTFRRYHSHWNAPNFSVKYEAAT